jgi:hypothetical protein
MEGISVARKGSQGQGEGIVEINGSIKDKG